VAARLLAPFAAADAARYGESAAKAWRWAAAQSATEGRATRDLVRWRAYAAVELFRLAQDALYRDAFLAVTELAHPGAFVEQPEASFAYARLPGELSDPARRSIAVDLFRAAAERAITFGAGNGYGVITDRTDLPVISYVGYFSTPGMASQNLPRAHYLTGDARHLAAVVQACNYSLGANPEGRTFTVGLGHDWPKQPLHLDSRRTGQPAPSESRSSAPPTRAAP
jgi:endoglucanase